MLFLILSAVEIIHKLHAIVMMDRKRVALCPGVCRGCVAVRRVLIEDIGCNQAYGAASAEDMQVQRSIHQEAVFVHEGGHDVNHQYLIENNSSISANGVRLIKDLSDGIVSTILQNTSSDNSVIVFFNSIFGSG